jgi:transglutaminase-like putative cysteine protease
MIALVLLATTVVFACRPDAGFAPFVASALVLVGQALPMRARELAWVTVVVGLAVFTVVTTLGGAGSIDAVVVVLVAVMAFIARSPTNDRVALAVCAVAMMRACQDAPSAVFIAALLVQVAAGVPILADAAITEVTGQVSRAAPRLAVAVLALAVPLFVVIPRIHDPEPAAFTGFSTDVTLGDDPTLIDNPATVLTVTLPSRPSGSIYLRGAVFERFDGHSWSTRRPSAVTDAPAGDDPAAITAVIRSEPVDQGVVFTLGNTVRIDADGPLRVDPAGAWHLDGPPRASTWTLRAIPPFGPGALSPGIPPERADRELPPVDPQVQALAAEWAGEDPAPRAIVGALRAHLAGYAYTRAAPESGVADPLLAFLMVRKAGHCEYFASALAVLARQQGVPARVVTGFAGGEWVEEGHQLVVRASDAHAWVEVWLDGAWETVDATPGPALRDAPPPDLFADAAASWRDTVDAFGPDEQLAMLRVGSAVLLGPIGVLVAFALVFAGLARAIERSKSSGDTVSSELIDARRRLVANGWRIPAALPPMATAKWLRERIGDEAEPFERLAAIHYRVRYEGAEERGLVAEARALRRGIDGIRAATAFDQA